MSIGMSYNEYWYKDPNLVTPYYEAYKYRRKEMNEQLWLQGLYFGKAISASLSNGRIKYPKEPLDIYPKTAEEKKYEAEKNRLAIIKYFDELKRRWDNGNHR